MRVKETVKDNEEDGNRDGGEREYRCGKEIEMWEGDADGKQMQMEKEIEMGRVRYGK
jgi:hypothetical protein